MSISLKEDFVLNFFRNLTWNDGEKSHSLKVVEDELKLFETCCVSPTVALKIVSVSEDTITMGGVICALKYSEFKKVIDCIYETIEPIMMIHQIAFSKDYIVLGEMPGYTPVYLGKFNCHIS